MLHLIQRVVAAMQSRTRSEEGQTLVEYALIIALVSIAAVAALETLAGGINGVFGDINAELGGGGGGS